MIIRAVPAAIRLGHKKVIFLPVKSSTSDRLTFNAYLRQLIHYLLHAVYAKCKMTQSTGLWTVHTLRRIFLSENLQLCIFINTKIQLPVLSF